MCYNTINRQTIALFVPDTDLWLFFVISISKSGEVHLSIFWDDIKMTVNTTDFYF